jgi:hypothetical protein
MDIRREEERPARPFCHLTMITRKGEVDQPRAKKQHRKVKTGCRTCKQVYILAPLGSMLTMPRKRRIKCDEKFPACDRCVSAGRVCDGYGIWGGGGTGQPSAPPMTDQSQGLEVMKTFEHPALWISPSREVSVLLPGPRLSADERSSLEWLVLGTSTVSPRVYATPFWPSATLSAAMNSPMLLQATLALSSAHKRKTLDSADRTRGDVIPDSQEVFMLQQYSRALRNMSKHMSSEEKMDRTQLLLAAYTCAMFMLIESHRCNYDAIKVHLNAGVRVVKRLRELTSDEYIESEKLRYFACVQDQMGVYQRQSSEEYGPTPTPTLRYKSPADAQQYLDALIEGMEHAVEQIRLISGSAKARELCREELAYYIGGFDAWKLAAEATVASRAARMTSTERLVWDNLREQFRCARQVAQKHLETTEEMGRTIEEAPEESSEDIGLRTPESLPIL